MSWYEFLLFVHVSVAVIWIGGALMMQMFGVRASMLRDHTRSPTSARTSRSSGHGSSFPRHCSRL